MIEIISMMLSGGILIMLFFYIPRACLTYLGSDPFKVYVESNDRITVISLNIIALSLSLPSAVFFSSFDFIRRGIILHIMLMILIAVMVIISVIFINKKNALLHKRIIKEDIFHKNKELIPIVVLFLSSIIIGAHLAHYYKFFYEIYSGLSSFAGNIGATDIPEGLLYTCVIIGSLLISFSPILISYMPIGQIFEYSHLVRMKKYFVNYDGNEIECYIYSENKERMIIIVDEKNDQDKYFLSIRMDLVKTIKHIIN